MSIILGNGDVLKDLHIGNKVINKVVVGNKAVWQKEEKYLKITCIKLLDEDLYPYGVLYFKIYCPNTNYTVDKRTYSVKYSYDKKVWIPLEIEDYIEGNGYYYSRKIRVDLDKSIYIKNDNISPGYLYLNNGSYSGYYGMKVEDVSGEFKVEGTLHSLYNFTQIYTIPYRYSYINPIYLYNGDIMKPLIASCNFFAGTKNITDFSNLNIDFKCDALDGEYHSIYNQDYMQSSLGIFENSNIKIPPVLRSININDISHDYDYMFRGCTNLQQAPIILAKNLCNSYALYGLFEGCTSLVEGPHLHFTEANVKTPLYQMFMDCTNLISVKLDYTGNINFEDWMSGVGNIGTFYYNGSDTTRGSSAIPEGWTIQSFTS